MASSSEGVANDGSGSDRQKLMRKIAVAILASVPVALVAGCDLVFATNRDGGWDERQGFVAPAMATGFVLGWVVTAWFASRADSATLATSRALRVLAVLAFIAPLIGVGHCTFAAEVPDPIFPPWAIVVVSAFVMLPIGFTAHCGHRALERRDERSRAEEALVRDAT